MKRFICEQNISHFQKLLTESSDPVLRRTLEKLLASAKRELAILNSETMGADSFPPTLWRNRTLDAELIRRRLQVEFRKSPHPYMLIDPGPGLKIIDINDAYEAATFVRRRDVIGRPLFDVFPDNPSLEEADGVDNLYQSLAMVVKTGQPHAMAVQRYDIRTPAGEFIERHWQPINTPIHDGDSHLIALLHHIEDVTVLRQLSRGPQR